MNWENLLTNSTRKHKLLTNTPQITIKPNTKGASERVNQTLKTLLWKSNNDPDTATYEVYNQITTELKIHASRGRIYTVNMGKLEAFSEIEKKDIIKDVFKGKKYIQKKVKSKSKESNSALIEEIMEDLTRKEKVMLTMYLLSDYDELNIKVNKVKIGNSWRKWSKEVRKYLISLTLNEKEIDILLQKISKIFTKEKVDIMKWSVQPTDFLLQSTGTTWDSCHRVPISIGVKGAYSLGYAHKSHPWVSQSLDNVSTIAAIIDGKSKALIARRAIYINVQEKKALLGRAYPSDQAVSGLDKEVTKTLIKLGYKVNDWKKEEFSDRTYLNVGKGRELQGYQDLSHLKATDGNEYKTIYGYDKNVFNACLKKEA